MRLVQNSAQLPSGFSWQTAVAIGNCDGVHLGHHALIHSTVLQAKSKGLKSALLTFEPHPLQVLHPSSAPKRLSTLQEKAEILEALGLDLLWALPFDRNLAALEPEAFFNQFLVEKLGAKSVHVGPDFRFGKARSGNLEQLSVLCARQGIELCVQPAVLAEGQPVSSTRIRESILKGEFEVTRSLLGRDYSVQGLVKRREGRGRKLGFPTANVELPPDRCLPPNGVYVTRAWNGATQYCAVANLGYRPTFEDKAPELVLEVHVIDEKALDLYERILKVEFLKGIREEKKFSSVSELIARISRDVEYAKTWFAAARS